MASFYPLEQYKGIAYCNKWYAPEEILRCQCGPFYKNHPVMARIIWSVLSGGSGAIKPILFPFFTLIAAVVFPVIFTSEFIIAAFTSSPEKRREYYKNGKDWLAAWALILLATAGLSAFVFVNVYYFPLVVPIVAIITAIGISIGIHVYRSLIDPPPVVALPLS